MGLSQKCTIINGSLPCAALSNAVSNVFFLDSSGEISCIYWSDGKKPSRASNWYLNFCFMPWFSLGCLWFESVIITPCRCNNVRNVQCRLWFGYKFYDFHSLSIKESTSNRYTKRSKRYQNRTEAKEGKNDAAMIQCCAAAGIFEPISFVHINFKIL